MPKGSDDDGAYMVIWWVHSVDLHCVGRRVSILTGLVEAPLRSLQLHAMSTPMSPTRLDDDPEQPPPSAQPVQQRPSRASPPNNSHVQRTSGVPRRDARTVSHPRRAAAHPAVDHSANSQMHNHHTPSNASSRTSTEPLPATAPGSASQTATKPSASSAHPPPLLTSGVASTARTFFDPWNSSSTGHQRAENRLSGSTSWRQSRSLKLAEQYKGGLGGGKRVADTADAGSEDFGQDGRLANGGWEKGAKGLRTGGQKSLAEVWGKSKASTAARKSSQEDKRIEDISHLEPRSDREESAMRLEGTCGRPNTARIYIYSILTTDCRPKYRTTVRTTAPGKAA